MQLNGKSFVRRAARALLAAGLLATMFDGFAQGERFPNKPIQIISTATPGSQSDTLLRFLGQEAAKTLGQPIVVVTSASAAGIAQIPSAAVIEPSVARSTSAVSPEPSDAPTAIAIV